MTYFYHVIVALIATIRNVFRPAQTVSFPREIRPRPERFRASFALTHDDHGDHACIGCKKCQMVCPSGVITVTAAPKSESPNTGKKRGWAADYTLDMSACLFCELCVQVCPTDAIVMTKTPHKPVFFREDLFLTMDQLYAQESDVSWVRASRLTEMQDPERGLVALTDDAALAEEGS